MVVSDGADESSKWRYNAASIDHCNYLVNYIRNYCMHHLRLDFCNQTVRSDGRKNSAAGSDDDGNMCCCSNSRSIESLPL